MTWKLDYLVIDTPPGTGDIHLSLLESYFIDKVIFVSTPQKISLLDVSKSIDLYKRFQIKILGVIKNNIVSYEASDFYEVLKEMNIKSIWEVDFIDKIIELCDKGEILEKSNVHITDKIASIVDEIIFWEKNQKSTKLVFREVFSI